MRKKKCKSCKEWFQPVRPIQEVCEKYGIQCALELAAKKQAVKEKKVVALERKAGKQERKEHRDRKRALKSLSHWKRETQRVVNRYIVLRDRDQPCISSGTWDSDLWDAGHFRTIGAASHLRFNEDNIHKQTREQNVHHSGNIGPYRINLVNRIGLERVEALENDNSTKTWTREELEELRKKYKLKIKVLEKQYELEA